MTQAPTTDHDRWVDALDRLERLLREQAAALDSLDAGPLDVEFAVPMPVLPTPMPLELAGRARSLLRATDDLIERTRELSGQVRPRQAVRHPRPQGRSTSTRFDRRA